MMTSLLLGLALALPPSAETLAVSPLVVSRDVAVGEAFTIDVHVANLSSKTLKVRCRLADFSLDEDGEPVVLPQGKPSKSLDPWLVRGLERREWTLAPREQRMVTLAFRSTGSAASAYGACVFETVDGLEEESSLRVETGALLLLRRKDQTPQTKIRSLILRRNEDVLEIDARVENPGRAHWSGEATALLRGSDQRVLARIPLDGGTGTVLPGGARKFFGSWRNSGSASVKSVELQFEADGRRFRTTRPASLDDLSRPTAKNGERDGAPEPRRAPSPLAHEAVGTTPCYNGPQGSSCSIDSIWEEVYQ
jgi:hypothetical protein